MKWIGLTGGIASGKSTVSTILKQRGYQIVDADEIARQVVAPGTPGLKSVVHTFGPEMLNANGELDRRKLGQRVFGKPEELQRLNDLLHPLVRSQVALIKNQLHQKGIRLAFYDVPLLFENNMQADFDTVVVVTTTPELQALRLRSRNQLADTEIKARLSSQIPLKEKEAQAHFVIHNKAGMHDLELEVTRMLQFVDALPTRN